MTDFFTEDEVRRARDIIKSSRDSPQIHQRILVEIINDEVMARIDTATMQENSRDYMAYRLEFVAS